MRSGSRGGLSGARQVDPVERGDGLLLAIVVELEVAGGQSRHGPAVLADHGDRNLDHGRSRALANGRRGRRFLAAEYIPPEFEMPLGEMVLELVLFLLLPLLVGMVLGRASPQSARTLARWCVRIGFVVVAMGVFYSTTHMFVGNRLINVHARGTNATEAWNAQDWDVRS